MAKKRKRLIKKFRKYRKAVGTSAAFFCTLDRMFNRERLRSVRIGGQSLWIRTNTPDIEVAMSSLFEKEYGDIRAENPRTIIDLGANIGTSAIFFAQKYPGARIIAVEPEDGNFEMLLKNTHGFENIVAIKAAIWGASDTRTIQNRSTGHWGYTVTSTDNKTESTGQEISCITIKSLMDEHGIESIDLLKMDIEGGEKNVLEDPSEWIDAVKIFTIELHDRICMGCDRAFYLATKDFTTFEKHGEKVTAYRSPH